MAPDPIIPRGKPKPEFQSVDEDDLPPNPIVVDRPAFIYRYPDGRLYVSIRPNGAVGTVSKRGSVYFDDLDTKLRVDTLRSTVEGSPWIDYPKLSDRRTFEERRAAGKESYVRGEVLNEHGVPIAATILIDPKSGQPLRAPVGKEITLTVDQIKKLGLTRWHQPHRRSR